jgi:FAD binding domain
MPPTGGQGGNIAMLDGLHLAWKLAAVVKREAGPGLLASHSDEQLPYGEAVADWQYANMIERQRPDLADDSLPAPVDPTAPSGGPAPAHRTSRCSATARWCPRGIFCSAGSSCSLRIRPGSLARTKRR